MPPLRKPRRRVADLTSRWISKRWAARRELFHAHGYLEINGTSQSADGLRPHSCRSLELANFFYHSTVTGRLMQNPFGAVEVMRVGWLSGFPD
jgi:hypothetical protein